MKRQDRIQSLAKRVALQVSLVLMRHESVVCMLAISSILALAWMKDAENQRDREIVAAWQHESDELAIKAEAEATRVDAWLKGLFHQEGVRPEIEARLSNWTLSTVPQMQEDIDDLSWLHPQYGIELDMTFAGDKLVGLSRGYDFTRVFPMPPLWSRSGYSESFRCLTAGLCVLGWAAAVAIAAGLPHYRPSAAKLMIVCGLGVGAAWLVSPWYSLNLPSILSNSWLVLSMMMYLFGVLALSLCVTLDAVTAQFNLRTMLLVTAVVALLVAIGPLGYVAIFTFLAGGITFAALVSLRGRIRRGKHRGDCAGPAPAAP